MGKINKNAPEHWKFQVLHTQFTLFLANYELAIEFISTIYPSLESSCQDGHFDVSYDLLKAIYNAKFLKSAHC